MKNLLASFLILFSMACVNKTAEESTKLKEETFKLHDEIMPVSMNLEDLKAEVVKKATTDTTLKNDATEISLALDKAYTDMENWMPKLGETADMKDGEEKLKALMALKLEGERLKQTTLTAKKKAEDFLK